MARRDCASWDDPQSSCNTDKELFVYGEATHGLFQSAFQPGGVYKVLSSLTNQSSTAQNASIGIRYASGSNAYVTVSIPAYATQEISGNLLLPANSAYGRDWEFVPQMVISCSNCKVYDFHITLLPTRYRVAQKTLSDSTLGTSHTFHYEYDGAATNDAAHSAAVAEKTRRTTPTCSTRHTASTAATPPAARSARRTAAGGGGRASPGTPRTTP